MLATASQLVIALAQRCDWTNPDESKNITAIFQRQRVLQALPECARLSVCSAQRSPKLTPDRTANCPRSSEILSVINYCDTLNH